MLNVALNTHDISPPRGPIVDLFVDELWRRIRDRLKRHQAILVVDDHEIDDIARDLAEAVVG